MGCLPFTEVRQSTLSRSFARARPARSLRMTAPRELGREGSEGGSGSEPVSSESYIGGWLLSFPRGARERVILSAAGAKDLLSEASQVRRLLRARLPRCPASYPPSPRRAPTTRSCTPSA